MSPMSTAAMNAVSQEKSGATSGIVTMSRMVGGTFGVAAFGALFQHLSSERLADSLSEMASSQRDRLVENLGSGATADRLAELDPATAQQVGRAVEDAFIHALSSGMWLATGVALVGAVAAAVLIGEREAAERPAPEERPRAAAEAEAVSA